MSMRDKLLAAANQAAIEATANERGRCLWCLGQVMSELQTKLNAKLLSSVELEAAKMKLKIANAVCMELRRAIVSGVRPAPAGSGETGQTGPADTSPRPVPPAGIED